MAGTAAGGLRCVFEGTTTTGVKGVWIAAQPTASARRLEEGGGGWALTKLLDNATMMPAPDDTSRFVELGGAEGGNPVRSDPSRAPAGPSCLSS